MLLIDIHTHLHQQVRVDAFISAAYDNFHEFGDLEKDKNLTACICLADYHKAEGFERLQSSAEAGCLIQWKYIRTKERYSFGLKNSSNDILWIIAGRQIVTNENIEVLACGIKEKLPNNISLTETIEMVEKNGALPLLPWGVGKWWGKRGRLVKSAINKFSGRLAICDNGGRPWFWIPFLFRQAKNAAVVMVSGSDPMSLEKDCLRAGSFGQILEGDIDNNYPAKWIKDKILGKHNEFEGFGKAMSARSFIARQIMIRKK